MSDQNSCNFTGRLGQDPEVRFTKDGTAVCNLRIAVGRKYKDRDETAWLTLVAFGRQAEVMGEHLRKGSQLWASTRVREREWKTNDGQNRTSIEFVVEQFGFLTPRAGQQSGGGNDGFQDAPPF